MKRVFRSLRRHKVLTTFAVGIIVLVSAMTVSANHKYDAQQAAAALAASKAACRLDPQTFLNTVNQWRTAAHVQPLQYSMQLQQAAQARIADMVQYQYYGHDNPTTHVESYTITRQYDSVAGYTDEVLASPATNASEALTDFKNSLEHYDSLISSNYNYLGLVTEYLPESWAEYDNTGKLTATAGTYHPNCIVIGELADKIGQAPTTITTSQATNTSSNGITEAQRERYIRYQEFLQSQSMIP